MRLQLVALPLACALALGCVKEISTEERLDRATAGLNSNKPLTHEELSQIKCSDIDGELTKARNVERPENERVLSYSELYTTLRQRTQQLQDALARDPDLSYQDDANRVRSSKDVCAQQTLDVRAELERFVRELVDVPIVQEVKSGKTTSVARLDFGTLRKAILLLDTEDRDALMQKVAAAEKRVEGKSSGRGR